MGLKSFRKKYVAKQKECCCGGKFGKVVAEVDSTEPMDIELDDLMQVAVDGLDATKLNASDGGKNVQNQRGEWYITTNADGEEVRV